MLVRDGKPLNFSNFNNFVRGIFINTQSNNAPAIKGELKTIPTSIVHAAKESLSTSVIALEHQDTSISKILGKKRGNATYNFHMSAKTKLLNNQAQEKLQTNTDDNATNTLFCTLTTQYIPNSIKSTKDAITRVHARLPLFIKYLKRIIGNFDYMYCLECHACGGCHVHIVIQLEDKYRFYTDDNGKFRNDFLRATIKKLWSIGHVDVQGVMNDNGVFNYVYKELGKSQNVEGSLERYEKDEKLVKNDSNKIWLLGAVYQLKQETGKNIRFFCYSKGYSVTPEDVKQAKKEMIQEYHTALINNMTKSDLTESNNDILYSVNAVQENKITRYVCMNKNFARHLPFFYKSGKITDKNTLGKYREILDKYGLPAFGVSDIDFSTILCNSYGALVVKVQRLFNIRVIKTAKDVMLYNCYKSDVITELEKLPDKNKNNPVILGFLKRLVSHQDKLRGQMSQNCTQIDTETVQNGYKIAVNY